MFGQNPIRKIFNKSGDVLGVKAIFKTIQEGIFAGTPSIFIRLGGCNLQCSFCDTEFEDFASYPIHKIIQQALKLNSSNTHSLAVITGGEPFLQNISGLCDGLIEAGFKVQIETNGTIFRPIAKQVSIICSPKNIGRGYIKIREDLLKRLDALKFIISASNPLYKDIAELGQSKYNTPVYLQPMDEYDATKNKENLQYTVNLAQKLGIEYLYNCIKLWI